MACGREGSGMVPKMWKKPFVGKDLALFGSVGQRACAHSIHRIDLLRNVEVWLSKKSGLE